MLQKRLRISIGTMIFVVLMISLMADILCWYLSPDSVAYQQDGRYTVLNADEVKHSKSNEENGVLIPEKSTVRLEFSVRSSLVNGVVIRTRDPLDHDSRLRLYYRYGTDKFSKERSVGEETAAGRTEIWISVPEEEYTDFRLDYYGPLALQEISIGYGSVVQIRKLYQVNWLRLLLLAAAGELLAFLYIYVNPVRMGLRFINYRILDPENRFKIINYLYMIFALIMLLHHVYDAIWMKKAEQTAALFHVSWLVFAVVSVLLGRMWKDRGFWFLAALLLLQYLRVAILHVDFLEDVRYYYLHGIYAFFGCYSVGRVLSPKTRKTFLKTFCILWTAAMTVLSVLGIYVVWTGKCLITPAGREISIVSSRLYPIYRIDVFGIMASVSIAVAFIGYLICEKKVIRIGFLAGAVLIFAAGLFTASRNNHIITAVELSLMLCVMLYRKLVPKSEHSRYRFPIRKRIIIFASFAALVLLFVFIQPYITDGMQRIPHAVGLLLDTASAEETERVTQIIGRRDMNFGEGGVEALFSGRIHIWRGILQYFAINLTRLCTGESMAGAKELLGRYSENPHAHNVLFQILTENGLPGLFLFFGFCVHFFLHARRLLKQVNLPVWQALISVPVIGCLVGDLGDLTSYIKGGNPQMTLLYLFAGMSIAFGGEIRCAAESGRDKKAGFISVAVPAFCTALAAIVVILYPVFLSSSGIRLEDVAGVGKQLEEIGTERGKRLIVGCSESIIQQLQVNNRDKVIYVSFPNSGNDSVEDCLMTEKPDVNYIMSTGCGRGMDSVIVSGSKSTETVFREEGYTPICVSDSLLVYACSGYAGFAQDMTKEGLVTRRSYYNEQGEPEVQAAGYSTIRCLYNKKGNRTEERYYGPDGNPCIITPGRYSSVLYMYNKDYYVESVSYFDNQGLPVNRADLSYASQEIIYDKDGNTVGEKFFGISDEPILTSLGYASYRKELNTDKEIYGEQYFDTNGQLIGEVNADQNKIQGNVLYFFHCTEGASIQTDGRIMMTTNVENNCFNAVYLLLYNAKTGEYIENISTGYLPGEYNGQYVCNVPGGLYQLVLKGNANKQDESISCMVHLEEGMRIDYRYCIEDFKEDEIRLNNLELAF